MELHVTTLVDAKTIEFQKPIEDPFIHQTITTETRLAKWLPWPRWVRTVEIIVGGDREALQRWFGDKLSLDAYIPGEEYRWRWDSAEAALDKGD